MKQKHLLQVIVFVVFICCFSAASWAGGVIGSAETKTGTLAEPSYKDSWTFDGTAGDRVVITAAGTSGGVAPQLYLYPPGGGTYEASAAGPSSAQRLDHQLLQSGTYTIIIQEYGLTDVGNYGISVAKIPGAATSPTDPDGGIILPAQTLTGTMNLASDTDIFQFNGTTGDRVVTSMAISMLTAPTSPT